MEETVTKILQYYAVMQLVSLPLTFVLLVFLYKKTNYIERFNAWLDRFFGLADKENKTFNENERRLSTKEKIAQDLRDAKTGVTTLKLAIGQSYHCRQSLNLMRQGGYRKHRWYPENAFVGDIDSEGLFTASKAGETDIYYEEINTGDDTSQLVYKIHVLPENDAWNPGKIFILLFEGKEKKEVMARLYTRRLSAMRQDLNTVEYRRGEGDGGLRLQFDFDDRLQRFAVMLGKKWKENGLKEIERALLDRFEPVKMEQGDTKIWIHKYITETETSVDHYCFMRELPDGSGVLCFSRCWREYSDELEFLQNIAMAELTFAELLPELEPNADLKAVIPDDLKVSSPNKDTNEGSNDDKRNDGEDDKADTEEKDGEEDGGNSEETPKAEAENGSTSGTPYVKEDKKHEKENTPSKPKVERRSNIRKNSSPIKEEKKDGEKGYESAAVPAKPEGQTEPDDGDEDSADFTEAQFAETYSQTPDLEDYI